MFYRLSEQETHFNFLTKFKFYPKLGKLGQISFKRLKNKFSLFYTFLYPIFYTFLYPIFYTFLYTIFYTFLYPIFYTFLYPIFYTFLYPIFYTFLYPIFASCFILLYISRSKDGTI